ncbi:MAG: hypothetical protein ACJZ37_04240 [Candidatus Poseidoniales archaeon]
MGFGLIFLFFLPIGVPLSLIIIPFLAGRSGANELPKDWHSTFIITVGGGCSLGLVFSLYLILSLSLGPSLKIGIAEPIILAIVAALIWGSFFIGVRNSTELKSEVQINEEEWDREEQEDENDSKEMIAIAKESETFEKENVSPKAIMAVTENQPSKSKDVKDKLADLKNEFKKTKKRSAELGVKGKKS